jgi:diketogulonate reductase-like aldo/keto reductase
VQTKYTPISGQDPNNIPYDRNATLEEQVRTSVASSLYNLRPTKLPDSVKDAYIDCLILHSPLSKFSETMEVWKVMESLYESRSVRSLGISNVNPAILQLLYQECTVPPLTVQNRFYAGNEYDMVNHEFCKEKAIFHESFWTLSGNPKLLASKPVAEIVAAVGVSREVAMYSLVIDMGFTPLNGTTNAGRMREDLENVQKVKEWSAANGIVWNGIVNGFGSLLS